MAGFVCLTIAVLCALIARVLLFMAALDISIWWAMGIFLPFGPLLFRLSYPEAARRAFVFRIATVASVFLYILLGPGASISPLHKRISPGKPAGAGYASELVSRFFAPATPRTKVDTVSLEDRRAANAREFDRLSKWSEALRAQKRDVLRSDVEGNRAYSIDLQEYNNALAAATAEKQVLVNGAGK